MIPAFLRQLRYEDYFLKRSFLLAGHVVVAAHPRRGVCCVERERLGDADERRPRPRGRRSRGVLEAEYSVGGELVSGPVGLLPDPVGVLGGLVYQAFGLLGGHLDEADDRGAGLLAGGHN